MAGAAHGLIHLSSRRHNRPCRPAAPCRRGRSRWRRPRCPACSPGSRSRTCLDSHGRARQSGATNRTSAVAMSAALPRSTERVHILYAPVGRNAPALDGVHVVEKRSGFERSALGDELLVRRLRVAGLIRCPALDHRRLAVPYPGKAKAGLADRQHRLLQRGEVPALAAVGRHLDPRDLARARSRRAR